MMPAPTGLVRHTVTTHDQHRIRVDAIEHPGSMAATLVVLPCGVSSHPMLPLVHQLGLWGSVYAIYSRFVLDAGKILESTDAIDASAHAQDVATVAAWFGLSHYAVLGYCTGALVALHSAPRLGSALKAIVCCNGTFVLGPDFGAHERELAQLVIACAGRRRAARVVRQAIQAQSNPGALGAEFAEHTRLAYRDDETFYKYMSCLQALYSQGLDTLHQPIETPTLLIAGHADTIVSAEQSLLPQKILHNAELSLLDGADHYFPCRPHTEGLAHIDRFLQARLR